MRAHHYLDPIDGSVIRVKANRRPSTKTRPRDGTWIVREFHKGIWTTPSFPEVTLAVLSKLNYLGSVQLNATTVEGDR